jgi:alpha-2-macroglobulin
MRSNRYTAWFAAGAIVMAACTGGGSSDDSGPTTTGLDGATNTPVLADPPDDSTGPNDVTTEPTAQLGLRLSEGAPAAAQADSTSVVDGVPLSEAEVAAVLDRLPDWVVPDTDVAEFNRPVETLKPPVVGSTVDTQFPPATGAPSVPDATADGPLEVVRFQPEGDVDVAPFIAISFNEPMVALATLDQLDDIDVPVTIEPDISATAGIDGRWRWIGTRTLRFEAVPGSSVGELDRLPAATEYSVTVAAGTESVNGAVLAESTSLTFSTPAATVTGLTGLADSMDIDPVFVATFDQRVDPDAVLDVIALDAGDVTTVRLATAAEIDADTQARATVDQALPDRAVGFVPTEPLPTDTKVSIEIGPGTPSLEGPRTNDAAFEQSGRTYAPLKVKRGQCFDPCAPLSSFDIEFNNPLDREAFDPAWINVEPAVPGLRVDNLGSTLSIRGATAANTTYTVMISADIVDVYGQTLGEQWDKEFDVGDARPFLLGPDRPFVTTDPFAATPSLSYTSVNHENLSVTAWQVTPDQYGEYESYLETTYSDVLPDDPSWPVVLDTTVPVTAESGAIVETDIDLADAFAESGGPIVLRVQPDPLPPSQSDEYWQSRPIYTWVQTTTLAVDAFADGEELLVWVTDLLTGAPVSGATIELIGARTDEFTTAGDGTVRVPLDADAIGGLVARSDDRIAMLPAQFFGAWQASPTVFQNPWYVIDDRGIYRPGETVRMTGIVRLLDADAQLQVLPTGQTVRYRASDPAGNELATGSVPLNALGGFNVLIEIPEASGTGYANVELYVVDSVGADVVNLGWNHSFQVQDFRTPDFEVTARAESTGPYYVVEPATVAVDATYFAGGPLGDAEVNWFVSTSDTTYSPPNWDEFSFGVWRPWWYADNEFGGDRTAESAVDSSFIEECAVISEDGSCVPNANARYQTFTGRTDAGGSHFLQVDFADTPVGTSGDDTETDDGDEPTLIDQPTTVTAEATVFDVNRQAIASRTTLLVHPAQYYVGLRSDRSFVEQGEPIVIDSTVVDVDGAAVAGRTLELTAGRLDYSYESGNYVEELVDVQTCSITSTDAVANDAPDDTMRCEFTTEVGGQYQITAIVVDDDGRQNRAVYTQWVSGATARPTRNLQQGEVVIVPDAEDYTPGDTAELLVQAPFAPASGVVVVTRAGIESVQTFDAADGSAIVSIPIAENDVPALDVRVDMVGVADRVDANGAPLADVPKQPAYAAGEIQLQIPPVQRTLEVTATPASAELLPGASTSVSVGVVGPDGEPVADAGVAVIVVDEAVLSLSGYELLDPLGIFYQPVYSSLQPSLLRDSIILANPEVFGTAETPLTDATEGTTAASDEPDAAAEAAPTEFTADTEGGLASRSSAPGAQLEQAGTPIDVRAYFDALAVFAPDETTDAAGTVTVNVDLPDNLTRYRVMAVAVSGVDRFGSGESQITARVPISVRPSAPRFLNFGDRFELPVVVQNQTDQPVEVDVAIETANLDLTDGAGRRVSVPANDRIEVRFPAAAADVGTARFRVASVSGEIADAAEVALPVYTPATAEAFATYGVVDADGAIAQPVLAPTGVFPEFGGLEISTSSTALQALTDAVLYLYDYRYESADGYASRIMAVAALRDVLDAFDADGLPDAAELDALVQRDIQALQRLQNDDGGFPWWQRGRESIPWVSVQATHAQLLAKENGYAVDQFKLDVSLAHLADIDSFIPSEYSQPAKDAVSAYALYVRDLAGDADPAKALALYRRGVDDETLQLDSIAQLWPVIDDAGVRSEIERLITNAAVETPSDASFATSYGEDAYVIAHSDRRTDGIILGALVSESPDSDLVVKVVNGLLANQSRGRWNNAQENSFILLSLNSYFDTFESIDPDFVAQAWLGDTYAVEAEFRGRSTTTSLTTVPMADVIAAGDTNLVVDKTGAGRLYYRLGLRYAPDDLDLDARDEGFVVERTYEAVDDPTDVERDPDGTWRITAGATVRVRLAMVTDAVRTQVALIDPLPAGLEPVNPALATSLSVEPDEGSIDSERSGYWWWQWFDHQNLRDDRAEAFSAYLPGGTYEYTYIARATTPGEFVAPPTRAEEIFAAEVFGRSASDAVIVE